MAAAIIPFPKPLKKEKTYLEPFEAEYLALVATDGPVGPGHGGGQVLELRTRVVPMGNRAASPIRLTGVGFSKSA